MLLERGGIWWGFGMMGKVWEQREGPGLEEEEPRNTAGVAWDDGEVVSKC